MDELGMWMRRAMLTELANGGVGYKVYMSAYAILEQAIARYTDAKTPWEIAEVAVWVKSSFTALVPALADEMAKNFDPAIEQALDLAIEWENQGRPPLQL